MRWEPLLLLLAACSPEPPALAPAPSPAEATPDPRPLSELRTDVHWSPPEPGKTQGPATDPKNDLEKAFNEVDQSPDAK